MVVSLASIANRMCTRHPVLQAGLRDFCGTVGHGWTCRHRTRRNTAIYYSAWRSMAEDVSAAEVLRAPSRSADLRAVRQKYCGAVQIEIVTDI